MHFQSEFTPRWSLLNVLIAQKLVPKVGKNILTFLVQWKTLLPSEFSSSSPPTSSVLFGRLWSVSTLPVFKQNRPQPSDF